MPEPLSPYALLKSSKPRPPAVYTTSYDAFSAVSQSAAVPAPLPMQIPPAPPPVLPPMPCTRTHYIADIKARHSFAAKHSRMSVPGAPAQSPPSLQTPST